MIIRKAKAQDSDAIVGLWHELMEYHFNLTEEGSVQRELHEMAPDAEKIWRGWLKKTMRNGLVLIAAEDDAVIGYSMNIIKQNVKVYKVKRLGYMSDLFIKQGYRKKGIGKAFMEEACSWFGKKRIRYVSIAAHVCNPMAIGIYRKWGFSDYHVELRLRR